MSHRKVLIQRALSLRQGASYPNFPLNIPASLSWDHIQTPNRQLTRCRIVLAAHGCSVATCTMCALALDAVSPARAVTDDDWCAQLQHACTPEQEVDIITLYHNGNFFANQEVSLARRAMVYRWFSSLQATTLVVESLPQFITREAIEQAHMHLRADQHLEVAIGLQSTDDFLREHVVASTCRMGHFINATQILRAHGDEVQVFLMFQLPFLTVQESAHSLLQSLQELYTHHQVRHPTICPLRIAPRTVAYELHRQGSLDEPSNWHLMDLLMHLHKQCPEIRPRVAVSLMAGDDGVLKAWFTKYSMEHPMETLERSVNAPPVLSYQPYQKEAVVQKIEYYMKKPI